MVGLPHQSPPIHVQPYNLLSCVSTHLLSSVIGRSQQSIHLSTCKRNAISLRHCVYFHLKERYFSLGGGAGTHRVFKDYLCICALLPHIFTAIMLQSIYNIDLPFLKVMKLNCVVPYTSTQYYIDI